MINRSLNRQSMLTLWPAPPIALQPHMPLCWHDTAVPAGERAACQSFQHAVQHQGRCTPARAGSRQPGLHMRRPEPAGEFQQLMLPARPAEPVPASGKHCQVMHALPARTQSVQVLLHQSILSRPSVKQAAGCLRGVDIQGSRSGLHLPVFPAAEGLTWPLPLPPLHSEPAAKALQGYNGVDVIPALVLHPDGKVRTISRPESPGILSIRGFTMT